MSSQCTCSVQSQSSASGAETGCREREREGKGDRRGAGAAGAGALCVWSDPGGLGGHADAEPKTGGSGGYGGKGLLSGRPAPEPARGVRRRLGRETLEYLIDRCMNEEIPTHLHTCLHTLTCIHTLPPPARPVQ